MTAKDWIIAVLAAVALASLLQAVNLKGRIEGRAPACTLDVREPRIIEA